jgi:Trk-type K+ transport system membrane component
MPRLHRDWKKIVWHAWSVRLLAVATVLSIAAALWPSALIAALAIASLAGAVVARISVQRQFSRQRSRLRRDWKKIVRHAWSVRLLALAGVLSGVETAVPFLQGYIPVSPGTFAILSALSTCAALISRVVAQKQFGRSK